MLIKYMGVLMDINEYTAADFRNFVLIYCALPYIEYYTKMQIRVNMTPR